LAYMLLICNGKGAPSKLGCHRLFSFMPLPFEYRIPFLQEGFLNPSLVI